MREYKNISSAFSTLEVLISLLILSIIASFALKPNIEEHIAIRKAAMALQLLQTQLNEAAYYSFLSKTAIKQDMLLDIMKNSQFQDKHISLILRRNAYILRINNKQLRLDIRQNSNGTYTIGCNPSQILCRKIYHRKHNK